jgi:hypothetical protein
MKAKRQESGRAEGLKSRKDAEPKKHTVIAGLTRNLLISKHKYNT